MTSSSDMELTIVALIGAVTGVLGLVLGFINTYKQFFAKPRLTLHADPTFGSGKLDIINNSNEIVSIYHVYIRVHIQDPTAQPHKSEVKKMTYWQFIVDHEYDDLMEFMSEIKIEAAYLEPHKVIIAQFDNNGIQSDADERMNAFMDRIPKKTRDTIDMYRVEMRGVVESSAGIFESNAFGLNRFLKPPTKRKKLTVFSVLLDKDQRIKHKERRRRERIIQQTEPFFRIIRLHLARAVEANSRHDIDDPTSKDSYLVNLGKFRDAVWAAYENGTFRRVSKNAPQPCACINRIADRYKEDTAKNDHNIFYQDTDLLGLIKEAIGWIDHWIAYWRAETYGPYS